MLATRTALATALAGMFVMMTIFGLATPSSFATIPVSVTYYLGSATCPITSYLLTTTIPASSFGGGQVQGFDGYLCNIVYNATYVGQTFTITSITVTLFGVNASISIPESPESYPLVASTAMQSQGLASSVGQAWWSPSGTSCSSNEYTLNPVPSSGMQLVNGKSFRFSVVFGPGRNPTSGPYPGPSYPVEYCVGGTSSTASSVTISGYAAGPSVPEFPLGLVALMGVALPAMLAIRAKYSRKLHVQ